MSLYAIQIWTIFELILIVLMILLFSLTRWYINNLVKKNRKKKKKIIILLKEINDNPNALTPQIVDFFNRSILELLLCMEKAERKNTNNPNWDRTKKLLSEHVLKNQSIKLSKSNHWFKKQLTLLCYELGFNLDNEKTLLKFVNDNNLIISINAAIQLFKNTNPNPSAINEVITTFSKGRHILQNTLAALLTTVPSASLGLLRTIFIARLNEEKDTYVRIFCYRILMHLERPDKLESFVEEDLSSENVDLKILTLKYVAHAAQINSSPILLRYLNDTNDDVRSTIVKLFGEIGDESLIPYLNNGLKDSEWWIRINSANSLLKLGTKGIAVLHEQSPQIDKFAYETAQSCLKIYQSTSG